MMHLFFYLHGWASSPQSNKASFFRQRFSEQGISLTIPDLNQPDFYHLTLSRQIEQVEALLPRGPVVMMGSSFGALTALWLAERHSQIEKLILLAPAFDFAQRLVSLVGEAQLAQWQTQGELSIFHYAEAREIPLSYAFVQDLSKYPDTQLHRTPPTLILHGRHDEVIPIQSTRDFVANRPHIHLIELESDHGLNDKQNELWWEVCSFCQLPLL